MTTPAVAALILLIEAALRPLADALWDLPERVFHYVAVDLLTKHHRQLDLDRLPRLL